MPAMLALPPDEALEPDEPDAVLPVLLPPVLLPPVLTAAPLMLPVDPLDEPPLPDVELPPIELPELPELSTRPCTWTRWFTSLRRSPSLPLRW